MSAKVISVVGLSFGDEGKGGVVDFLTRRHRAQLVVRHNGGGQAAHNVTDGGRHHTFAQFGSGTFAGARTHLSRYAVVNPISMLAETRHLAEVGVADPLALVSVDARALVTTPYHVALNRIKELARGGARHGSCGMGVGETVEQAAAHPDEAILAFDLASPEWFLREKLKVLRTRARRIADLPRAASSEAEAHELFVLTDLGVLNRILEDFATWSRAVSVVPPGWLGEALADDGATIFEGAQGVLLDQDHGFYPHTTWSDCTFGNVERLLAEADYGGEHRRVGVVRAYATRHGAGPLPTEVDGLPYREEHNEYSPWQGAFRVGRFDLPLLRYALEACGRVDQLAVTCLDHVEQPPPRALTVCAEYEGGWSPRATRWPVVEAQERLGRRLASARPAYQDIGPDFAGWLRERVSIPVAIESRGPRASDKRCAEEGC